MHITSDTLENALAWFNFHTPEVEVVMVGEPEGFEYDTLAVLTNEMLIEIASREIEYRAEL